MPEAGRTGGKAGADRERSVHGGDRRRETRGAVGPDAAVSGAVAAGADPGPRAGAGDHRHAGAGRAAVRQSAAEPQPRLRSIGQKLRSESAVPTRAGARPGGSVAESDSERLSDTTTGST